MPLVKDVTFDYLEQRARKRLRDLRKEPGLVKAIVQSCYEAFTRARARTVPLKDPQHLGQLAVIGPVQELPDHLVIPTTEGEVICYPCGGYNPILTRPRG